jgi:hypothetical protein
MAEERDGPSEDPLVEAERVTSAATEAGVSLKLLGGAGVWLHSPSARFPPLKRKYGDLDFAVPSRQRKAVQDLFPPLGYEPNERFNALQGDRRLFFWDTVYGRQVDIFLDTIKMCHVIDLRGRLEGADPCVSPADLLLSKLQIYELNQKDVVDLVALFLDHGIADNDDDAIDGGRVARLAAADWGLYRTLQVNTERLRAALPSLEVPEDLVSRRLEELWTRIEAQPKSLRWRLRAQVGDRVRWYELPEEVRSPYEPLY